MRMCRHSQMNTRSTRDKLFGSNVYSSCGTYQTYAIQMVIVSHMEMRRRRFINKNSIILMQFCFLMHC